METSLQIKFIEKWQRYFGSAELPLAFYFSDNPLASGEVMPKAGRHCFICELAKARYGKPLCFSAESIGCGGGKRNLGYTASFRPEFEYFLSCGNERVEGERYLKDPATVKDWISRQPVIPAHSRFSIFKRWDLLGEDDHPELIIFFATPDVLSGLFTLASFESGMPDGVVCPFSAGCGSIIQIPWLEKDSERPRAVIGMFDPSARPCVEPQTLTFSVAFSRFERMVHCMDESFLITPSWEKIRRRIG